LAIFLGVGDTGQHSA